MLLPGAFSRARLVHSPPESEAASRAHQASPIGSASWQWLSAVEGHAHSVCTSDRVDVTVPVASSSVIHSDSGGAAGAGAFGG